MLKVTIPNATATPSTVAPPPQTTTTAVNTSAVNNRCNCNDDDDVCCLIRNNEIGFKQSFVGPFGPRNVLYCDYASNARSLEFIEQFINEHVLPSYQNTHTSSTTNSIQTSHFREEAREIIKEAMNASEKNDCVIFAGSGPTCAVNKLITGLEFQQPPIVFLSPIENYLRILPWKEIECEIIYVNSSDDGSDHIDLKDLKVKLESLKSNETNEKRVKLACFTVCSTITGKLADVDNITVLLHKHKAFAIWDYNFAGSMIEIDMNPSSSILASKDAVFFSASKFLGGLQTTEVLVAKRNMFRNKIPNGQGGGTVTYVTKYEQGFIKDTEEREEGGTPLVVNNIRTGLVIQFKQQKLDHAANLIRSLEEQNLKKAMEVFKRLPNFYLLGGKSMPTTNANNNQYHHQQQQQRLALFTFMIRNQQTGLFLHARFVTKLLNDLFGIVAKTIRTCDGQHTAHLSGLNLKLAKMYTKLAVKQLKLIEPCLTRLNIPFFLTKCQVDYIIEAIRFISEHGWKFLTFYRFDLETGQWHHKYYQQPDDVRHLNRLSDRHHPVYTGAGDQKMVEANTDASMREAIKYLGAIFENTYPTISDDRLAFDKEANDCRWFMLPSEAYGILNSLSNLVDKSKQFNLFEPILNKNYENDKNGSNNVSTSLNNNLNNK